MALERTGEAPNPPPERKSREPSGVPDVQESVRRFIVEEIDRLAKVKAELAGFDVAHEVYLNEASRILDLAQRAYDVYMAQPDNFEQRKLLDNLVSKVVIKDKMALSNLKEPFQTLAKLASAATSGGGNQGWYPRQDSNLRPSV